MAELEDDDVFEKLIAEKRHNEIIDTLKNIFKSIDKKENIDLTKIVITLNKIIDNQVLLPKAVQLLSETIIKKIDNIKTTKDWKFTIERNSNGLISGVTAKQQ